MKQNIGTIIKKYCSTNRISIASLAIKINYTRTALYALLNRSDMSINTLFLISQALKHNFFQYLWNDKTIITKEEAILLRQEISQLKIQISQLTRENELLQKVLSTTVTS